MSDGTEPKKSWGPRFQTAIDVAIGGIIGSLIGAAALYIGVSMSTSTRKVNVEKTALVEKSVEPSEPATVGAAEARWQPGKRLFAAVVRKRAAAVLTKDGFLLVGGDPTPLSREKAEALLESLDDDTIVAAGKVSGATGDGKFLDRLDSLLTWLVDHKEQIAALVKFLLSLLAFA